MKENNIKREVLKISIIGNSSVGKTSLRNRYLNIEFNEELLTTVGYNKEETKITLEDGNTIKLVIWDTAGQERFQSMALNVLKSSQGIILVFDLTNKKSFEDLDNWLEKVKDCSGKSSLIIFGNKSDLEDRKIKKEEAEKFAKEHNIPYIETSAKLNINISEGFSKIANEAYKKFMTERGIALNKKKKNKQKKFC